MTSPKRNVSSGSPSSASPLRSVSVCSPSAFDQRETSCSPSDRSDAEEAGSSAIVNLTVLLRRLESAHDTTIALAGELASALVAAQAEQRLGAAVGQPAFMAFSQAMLHLSTARGHTVDGHRILEKIGRVFQIDTPDATVTGFGDEFKYPPTKAANTSSIAA